MELTLKNLLNARITKLRHDAAIQSKASRLLRTIPRFTKLLSKVPEISWEPTGAYEVSERAHATGHHHHEFVLFKINCAEENWCLGLHEKTSDSDVILRFYLFPSAHEFHLQQFRSFVKSVLHAPGLLSTAELELCSGASKEKPRWGIKFLHYRNPNNELVPQVFFSALTETEHPLS